MEILVNFFVAALGFFIFLGSVGGVIYVGDYARALISDWKLQRHTAKPSCHNCVNCNVCVEVMAGCMPNHACAYWEKKGTD